MGRHWQARARRRLSDEGGFSLIEAIVALSILAVVSTSFAYSLSLTMRVTRDDRLRQQATHLAERELEVVRNSFQHADKSGQLGAIQATRVVNGAPLPGGTAGQALVIDGRSFTVERTSSLQLNGNGASPCDGGGSVDYLTIMVNVRVTWTDSGTPHEVEGNTMLTPIKGVEGDVGYLAMKLTDSAGLGTENVAVVATGPSGPYTRYTAADGCAVFMLSATGTYTLTVDSAGYVNVEGFRTVSKSAALELGKLKVIPMSYDRSSSIRVSYSTMSGHQLPSPLPGLTLFNPGLAAPGEIHPPTGTNPVTVSGLWPFTAGYSVWAGSCDQSDPALNPLGYPRPGSVPTTPGGTATTTVNLAPIEIRTIARPNPMLPGVVVGIDNVDLVATPVTDTGCEGGDDRLVIGTTSGGGYLKTSLPAGTWLIDTRFSWIDCEPVTGVSSCPQDTDLVVVVDHRRDPEQPDGRHPARHGGALVIRRLRDRLRGRRETGLSLIEVMVTVGLTASVMAVVATGMLTATRLMGTNSLRLQEVSANKVAIDAMTKTLRTAVEPRLLGSTSTDSAFIQGDAKSVSFYAALSTLIEPTGSTMTRYGPVRVSYTVTGGKLIETYQLPDLHLPNNHDYTYCTAGTSGCEIRDPDSRQEHHQRDHVHLLRREPERAGGSPVDGRARGGRQHRHRRDLPDLVARRELDRRLPGQPGQLRQQPDRLAHPESLKW